jgi:methionyl-tRNA synthetase
MSELPKAETVYLTTAINYTNGPPHIGHAYEAVSTDIITRWHRLMKRITYFLTGTDEHGQKIAKTAESKGLSPIQLCDQNVVLFKELNTRLNISFNNFIRTTSKHHQETAQKMFQRVYDKGDIYLGEYVGWYNPREERFVTEKEASQDNPMKKLANLHIFSRWNHTGNNLFIILALIQNSSGIHHTETKFFVDLRNLYRIYQLVVQHLSGVYLSQMSKIPTKIM